MAGRGEVRVTERARESESARRQLRRALKAFSDQELVAAMRRSEPGSWAEFESRFRPLLEAYARRTGIPRGDRDTCVAEVLEDEMLRLAMDEVPLPDQLPGYLVRAVHHRRLKLQRAAAREDRRYDAATDLRNGQRVVPSVCSESTVRNSSGLPAVLHESGTSPAVARFARAIAAQLTEEERLMLAWVGEGVPRRQIAEWTGGTYESTRKRILRLVLRVRATAETCMEGLPLAEREDVRRFLRRAGLSPAVPGKSDRSPIEDEDHSDAA